MQNKKITILAIDDNQDNLITLKAVVSDVLPGTIVLTALTGGTGIKLALAENPDVILLDIIMPEMDGFEVCQRLKNDEMLQKIPVLFLTALKTTREIRMKALEAGAEGFLSKPFNETELIAQILSMAKIKAANQQQHQEKERLVVLVAERTQKIEEELIMRCEAEQELLLANLKLNKSQAEMMKVLEDLKKENEERKKAEKALRISEERLQTALEETNIGIWDWNLKTDFLYLSPVCFTMLGYEVEGDSSNRESWSKLAHPEDWQNIMTRTQKVLCGETFEYQYEARMRHANGEYRWHLVTGRGVEWDETGTLTRMIGVRMDITNQKTFELEILKAKEEAEAANRAKSQFLANMSHEIRTPLNGVMGMIQLLQMSELTEEQNEYIHISQTSSDALLIVINDILDYSKIEAGKIELDKKVFSPRKMINDVVGLFKTSAMGKGISLEVSIEKNVPDYLIGDSFRLRQIISNLCGNAVKFTNAGRIDISLTRIEGGYNKEIKLKIGVKDTGIGIPHGKADVLFRSFSQVDNSNTRKYGGSGLGLAISKNLVELMSGEIWVESREGEGSSFYFTCTLEMLDSKHESRESLVQVEVEDKSTNEIRILVAEDDSVSRMVIEKLSEKKGWQVIYSENGKEAINAYEKQIFDVIIMDCYMPILDGYKATEAIRQLESQSGRNTPIIAMTAYALKGDREKCIEAGMDDYLSKPVNVEEFYAAVERWTINKSKVQ